MVKLIKNLKDSRNKEMVKGCYADSCSVNDYLGMLGYPCPSVDLCGIDYASCSNVDVCYQLDAAGSCLESDECYVDTVECYAAYDYNGL
jgi:hypothetical protein